MDKSAALLVTSGGSGGGGGGGGGGGNAVQPPAVSTCKKTRVATALLCTIEMLCWQVHMRASGDYDSSGAGWAQRGCDNDGDEDTAANTAQLLHAACTELAELCTTASLGAAACGAAAEALAAAAVLAATPVPPSTAVGDGRARRGSAESGNALATTNAWLEHVLDSAYPVVAALCAAYSAAAPGALDGPSTDAQPLVAVPGNDNAGLARRGDDDDSDAALLCSLDAIVASTTTSSGPSTAAAATLGLPSTAASGPHRGARRARTLSLPAAVAGAVIPRAASTLETNSTLRAAPAASPRPRETAPPPGLLVPRAATAATLGSAAAAAALEAIEAQLARGDEAHAAPAGSYCAGTGYEQAAYEKLVLLTQLLGERPHEDAAVPAELALFWLLRHLLRRVCLVVALAPPPPPPVPGAARTPVTAEAAAAAVAAATAVSPRRAVLEAALPTADYARSLLGALARIAAAKTQPRGAVRDLETMLKATQELLESRTLTTQPGKLLRLAHTLETTVTLCVRAAGRLMPLPVREADGSASRLPAIVARYATEAAATERGSGGSGSGGSGSGGGAAAPRGIFVTGRAPDKYQRLYTFYARIPRLFDGHDESPRAAAASRLVALYALVHALVAGAAQTPPRFAQSGAAMLAAHEALVSQSAEPAALGAPGTLGAPSAVGPDCHAAYAMVDTHARARALCAALERTHAVLLAAGACPPVLTRARLALQRTATRLVELADAAMFEVLHALRRAPAAPHKLPRRAALGVATQV